MRRDLPVVVPRAPGTGSALGAFLMRQAAAAVDSGLLKAMMTADRLPDAEALQRVRSEVDDAYEHLRERGLLDDVHAFHRAPPVPRTVTLRRGFIPFLHERAEYASDYAPVAPAAFIERFDGYRNNRTARAHLMSHRGGEQRPWLICLHGLGTGAPWMDMPAFRARQLHQAFGMNLAFPVLPLHGARRAPGMHRAHMVSFELVDTVFALAQAVWDTRRLIRWLRAEGAQRIGLFGMSIGAYVAGLVAALEPTDLLLGAIPVSDIPTLYEGHTPDEMIEQLGEHALPSATVRALFHPVSPRALTPMTPPDRRFILAGTADRITPPSQAEMLWSAWGEPRIEWFGGGHVSFFWSARAAEWVDQILHETAFAREVPAL